MRRESGFTLIEVAFVLAIFGILSGLGLNYLKTSKQQENRKDNQQILVSAKNSLLNFLHLNHYLPCPSEKNDGYETRKNDGSCKLAQGHLPYIELDLASNQDTYGNSILYAINDNSKLTSESNHFQKLCSSSSLFANSGNYDNKVYKCTTSQNFYCTEGGCIQACKNNNSDEPTHDCAPKTLTRNQRPYSHYLTPPLGAVTSKNGAITLCKENSKNKCDSNTTPGDITANLLPVLLVSFGKNGQETWEHFKNCKGIVSTKEELNCDGKNYFYKHPQSHLSHNYFDDQFEWIDMFEAKSILGSKIYWH